MTAARYDITIDQGSDFSLELIVKEGTNAKDFSPDQTQGAEKAWGARASFRKTLDSTESFTLPCTVTQSNLGKITVTHGRAQNTNASAGTYLYDLEIFQYDNTQQAQQDAQGGATPTEFSVTRLIGGTLTLRREVTR